MGLTPIPTDANIEFFLNELQEEHNVELHAVLKDMNDTIAQTALAHEPETFAYAKLLNYLASEEVKRSMLIRLLAAAIWELT